ncbi:MAG: protein translocase subunit SecD [Desulfobacterales bacterium]
MKNFSWKWIFVLAVILIAVVYLLPSAAPGIWPHKKINLGLDLQGGMHLALEVETDRAVESHIERIAQELRTFMKSERIRHVGLSVLGGAKIEVKLPDKDNLDKFDALINKEYRTLETSRKSEDETTTVSLRLPQSEIDQIKDLAVRQALETIRNRIDQFGVSEPDIRRQGENRILVQLPGVKETERAKDLIGKTALLEFKLVDEDNDVNAALRGTLPMDSEILYQYELDPKTGQRINQVPFLLKKRTLLTGAQLTDARVQIDSQYNESYVSISFDKKGAQVFEKVTEENVKKRLAIVLDNRVYSAPVIQEKIPGGQARITGRFSTEEANDLAIALRAGALPAPVSILEERTVGPSLGSDSIRQGLLSMCIGGILVVLFMAIYYKAAGVIADIALLLNIVLIGGGLAAFQATLTLPGIAGIILTIGMAVDANVLIFERIREELHQGKTPRAAVDTGYERATLTILDANITTLIAALVLFQFGTGPVKGFAVTLSLGVIASLFTALIVTRQIFDFLILGRSLKRLSI